METETAKIKTVDLTGNLPKMEETVTAPAPKEPEKKEEAKVETKTESKEVKEEVKVDKQVDAEKKVIEQEKEKFEPLKKDRSWNALMDKENELRRMRLELKEKENQFKEFDDWKKLKELEKTDPLAAYNKMVDYEKYTDLIYQSGKKVDAKEKEVIELRKELDDTKQKITNFEQNFAKKEYDALDKENYNYVANMIEQQKEKYPVILSAGKQDIVKQYLLANVNELTDENGVIGTESFYKVSDYVESELRKELKSMKDLYDKLFPEVKVEVKSEAKETPKSEQVKESGNGEKITLTNDMASQPAQGVPEDKILRREDYVEKATKFKIFQD